MKYKNISFLFALLLLLPTFSYAATFQPLVGIPGLSGTPDFNTYINALYVLAISLAALLAVIKLIIAGVKWMLTDIVTSKADAKRDIQGALIGLLIIISAVVILNQINPQLTTTSIFIAPIDQAPSIKAAPATGPASVPTFKPTIFDCLNTSVSSCGQANLDCTTAGGKTGVPMSIPASPSTLKTVIPCTYP